MGSLSDLGYINLHLDKIYRGTLEELQESGFEVSSKPFNTKLRLPYLVALINHPPAVRDLRSPGSPKEDPRVIRKTWNIVPIRNQITTFHSPLIFAVTLF